MEDAAQRVDGDSRPDPKFTEKDKVQILLAEYNSLRSETVHRVNNVYQLVAVAAVAFVWFMGRVADKRFWIALLVCVPALCYYTFDVSKNIYRTAIRVAQIEKEINRRVGEDLLEWETWWGASPLRIRRRKVPR